MKRFPKYKWEKNHNAEPCVEYANFNAKKKKKHRGDMAFYAHSYKKEVGRHKPRTIVPLGKEETE